MVDYITSRGTLFYIVVWVVLTFVIEYGHRWFFKHYNVNEDGHKFATFLIIFITLISVTFLIPIKNGEKRTIPVIFQ